MVGYKSTIFNNMNLFYQAHWARWYNSCMGLKHFVISKALLLPEEIRNLPFDQYKNAIARFRVATVEVAVLTPDNKLLLLKRKQDPGQNEN